MREVYEWLCDAMETKGMLGSALQGMGQVMTKSLDSRLLLFLRPTTKAQKAPWKLLRHPLVSLGLVTFLLFFYVGIPVWFYFCPWIRRHAVFLNLMDWPLQDFAHPESYGLEFTRNFYVESSPGLLLGAWHVLPSTLRQRHVNFKSLSNYSFKDDNRPVVLYLHGSAESRSAAYRRAMYKVLSSSPLDFHVITFDYRGFGDSTYALPTVSTLVEDAEVMYQWLRAQVPLSRIYVWGHSLGSGVAVMLSEKTSRYGTDPLAIVLEAPFASVADATHTFPLSFFHRRLPFFNSFCTERTRHADTNLDSVEKVGNISAPLLILHAADDSMVWSEQGKRLWRKAIEKRTSTSPLPVFVELDASYGCGHRNIHKAPDLPYIVANFLRNLNVAS